MIIVRDKNEENTVYFPQNLYTKEYDFENLEDRHLVPYGFYTFFLNFSSCPQGEYEYLIADSHKETVGTGIIRLNSLEPDNVCYEAKFTYDTLNGQ